MRRLTETERAARIIAKREYNHRYYRANREKWIESNRRRRSRSDFSALQKRYNDAWAARYPDRARLAHRKTKLRLTYGLTIEQYDALLAAQDGVCAICGSRAPGRSLAVDHDHNTGKVRGLLCLSCNVGIGRLGDDPVRVRAAADYLDRGRA